MEHKDHADIFGWVKRSHLNDKKFEIWWENTDIAVDLGAINLMTHFLFSVSSIFCVISAFAS